MKYTDYLKEQLNKPGSFVREGSFRAFYAGTHFSSNPKDKIIEVGEDFVKVRDEARKEFVVVPINAFYFIHE
jgi:hypothetical protein